MTAANDDRCPHCGGSLRFSEKDTSSGREIREYVCDDCHRSVIEDRGKALWQVLHDDREEMERKRAEEAARAARRPLARLKKAVERLWRTFA